MATNTIGSTGDYTTTQAWFNDLKGTAGTHTGEVLDEQVSGSLVVNDGAFTATGFILKPTNGAEHDGRARAVSGSGAELEASSSRVIWWFNGDTGAASLTVQDLSIQASSGTVNAIDQYDNGDNLTIQRNVIYGAPSGAFIIAGGDAATNGVDMLDNIIYGNERAMDYRSDGDTAGNIHHNTCDGQSGANADFGILPGSAAQVCNNISVRYGTECYFGADAGDSQHGGNIASDATAVNEWNGGGGGTNSVEVNEEGDTPTADYVAFKNLTGGSEDYHLVDLAHETHSNIALEGGLASKGSGTDIDGDTRDGTNPDIGADEFVAAATGAKPPSGLALLGVGA